LRSALKANEFRQLLQTLLPFTAQTHHDNAALGGRRF